MKISIALATFNGAVYLAEQLDSIKRQSLQPTELIVSDDASTDDTVEIARAFARDAGFKVIVDAHEKLPGYNENFVRAIGQCTGDIVVLCDQDDVWADNKLAAAVAEFRDETVMAVSHRIQVVDERLQPTSLVLPQEALYGTFAVADLDPWFAPGGMHMLFRREPIAPWLLEKPPLSKWCDAPAPFDEWIFFLAGLVGKRVLMPDILGVWRRHSTSTTGSPEATKKAWSRAFQWQLAASTGAAEYAYAARVADSRAEVAERVARGRARAPSADDGVALYRRLSQTLRRRSQLHEHRSSRAKRLLILTDMVRRLDYRRRDSGGLGARSFVKDSFAVLRGPAAARPR
jgi:glycosyltransferase involved in cell wall biosynthesis